MNPAIAGLLLRVVAALTDPGPSCHSDEWYEDQSEKRDASQDCDDYVDAE